METVYYPSFANLNKFKVSLLQEEATEIESLFLLAQLKDGIYAIFLYIDVEVSMQIQIFIPVKAFFFLKGIQKSG